MKLLIELWEASGVDIVGLLLLGTSTSTRLRCQIGFAWGLISPLDQKKSSYCYGRRNNDSWFRFLSGEFCFDDYHHDWNKVPLICVETEGKIHNGFY